MSTLGLLRNTVRLVPHNPQWAMLFEREKTLIRDILGEDVVELAHIGSTAVPNVEAKPVLDLMLALRSFDFIDSVAHRLSLLGYERRPFDTVANRHFFAKPQGAVRTHNLSVCEAGSRFWSDHISFRDRLRSDALLALRYVALKRELVTRFPNNRLEYTNGKEQFILAALRA